jgi:DNA-binding response OmpR family regulator
MIGWPRVLVVDDSEDFRDGIAEVLTSQSARVSVACDGAEALALLARDPLPDLVLLDLWMPKLDGFGVLKAMREDPRLAQVRVIVMTAVDIENLAVPCLVKPFSVETLPDRMVAVLQQSGQPGADVRH